MLTYLAIEQDKKNYEKESEFWLSCNVSSIRVDSMNEGIEKAMNKQFLYITINSANINYMPTLKSLRTVTNDPIFISTDNYTVLEQRRAIELGADLFWQISENPSDNYKSVMALINRLYERSNDHKIPIKIITNHNLLLTPDSRKVFINDIEIDLTTKEFDVLYLLMNRQSFVFTPEEIYKQVWGLRFGEESRAVIWTLMARLRHKLHTVSQSLDYIKTKRKIGYTYDPH